MKPFSVSSSNFFKTVVFLSFVEVDCKAGHNSSVVFLITRSLEKRNNICAEKS